MRRGGMARRLILSSPGGETTRQGAGSRAATTSRQKPTIAGKAVLPRSQRLGEGIASRPSMAAAMIRESNSVALETPKRIPMPSPRVTPSEGRSASGHHARSTPIPCLQVSHPASKGRNQVKSRLTWRNSVNRIQKAPVIRKPIARARRPDGRAGESCAIADILRPPDGVGAPRHRRTLDPDRTASLISL